MELNISKTNELTLRPIQNSDLVEVVDLMNAADHPLVGHNILTVEELKSDLSMPDFDIDTDTRVVFTSRGNIAGYADYWAGPEPHVRIYGFVRIHPEHKGEGVGTAVTDWLEERAIQDLKAAPEGLRVTLGQRAYATQQNARSFLECRGYRHARSSYRMTINLDDSIPQPEWPQGLVMRSIDPSTDDLRLAIQAEQEAFLDHYGVMPEPFETYYERRKHFLLSESNVDFSACYMVLDGGQVAAVEFNATSVADDEDTGWVGTLSVRRPWRKQGLGLALLRAAFVEMHQRGKKRVGLYVDAENLTGALRLYQNAGMFVDYENCYYEKLLRPGKDLANLGT